MRKKAVFLDRDGTINFDPGYLRKASEFKLLPGARDALNALKNAGYLLIVVSNQSGVGRGFILTDDLAEIHRKLDSLIAPAAIDAYYLCTHVPDAGCDCRKPATRWARDAEREWNIDLSQSIMIGDRPSDLLFGINAGIGKAILVLTGHGQESLDALQAQGDGANPTREKYAVADDLAAAVKGLLHS